MKITNCRKVNLLAGLLLIIPFFSFAQTWEVYDQNFKLKSRIEFDRISILGESVRLSSTNNTLRLLSTDYKPFFNLKGDSVYQYFEPWILVKGPDGIGAFHEYGEEIFPPEYDKIETIYTKLLAKNGNSYSVYDRKTRKISEIGNFNSAVLAQNGQVIARSEIGYYLPLSNKPSQVYQEIKEVNENFLISKETKGFGLINREGQYVLDPIIDQMIHLEEDFFYAFDGKQYMLIKAREERADIKYISFHKITMENDVILEYIHGKLRRVMNNEGILLDYTGMEKVSRVGPYHYNVLLRDKRTGLLGPRGWEVNPVAGLDYIFPGNEQLYGVKSDGKFGFITKTGDLVIKNRFDSISKFSEGLAAVNLNGLWGFINKSDQTAIENQFDEVSDFHNGLAIVKKNGKSNLINQQGKLILTTDYSRLSLSMDNYYVSEENNLFGLIDPNGKEIVEPKFDDLRREGSNKILVRIGNKYGIMDESGNYPLPIFYKNIIFDQGNDQILAEDYYQFILPAEPLVKTEKKKKGV